MKTDLKDTTFIMPVRLDSIARLENLILAVNCIQKYFDTNIFVLEAAPYCNGIISCALQNVSYLFVEDKDPVFYKTHYLNRMAKEVKTNILAIWDVDVILEPNQILDSVQNLREGNCDVAYPFNGDYFDVSDIFRGHYFVNQDIEFLKKNKDKMDTLYKVDGVIGAVGGAIFIKTESYLNSGMDNEDFYGWGLEDGERYYRWLELDYKIYRNKDCLFHLSHPRDSNGKFRSINHVRKATHDFNEIVNYGKEELQRIVKKVSGRA